MTGGLAPAKNMLRVLPPRTTGAAKFPTKTEKKPTDTAAHLPTTPRAAGNPTRVARAPPPLSTKENIPGTSHPKTPLDILQITAPPPHNTPLSTPPTPTTTPLPPPVVGHLLPPGTTNPKNHFHLTGQIEIGIGQDTTTVHLDLPNVISKNLPTITPLHPFEHPNLNPGHARPQNTTIPTIKTRPTTDRMIMLSLMITFYILWYLKVSLNKEVITRKR